MVHRNQFHRRLLSGDQKKFACTTRGGQGTSQGGDGRMFSSRFTYLAVEYFDSIFDWCVYKATE